MFVTFISTILLQSWWNGWYASTAQDMYSDICYAMCKKLASNSTTFMIYSMAAVYPLQWRHNGLDGVSNHQPHHCLLSRLFGRRSKNTSKLRVTGLCVGIHRGPVNSPHKWPVARKMVPFDDVIMLCMMYQYWRCATGHWETIVCKFD